MHKIREEPKAASRTAGGTCDAAPGRGRRRQDDRRVRPQGSRLNGAGFYEYDGRQARPDCGRGCGRRSSPAAPTSPFEDMIERMLFAEALETQKCFDEGVLTLDGGRQHRLDHRASASRRGPVACVQYINQYEGGLKGFVARARELAQRYGSHFVPPASLVEKAEKGEIFE